VANSEKVARLTSRRGETENLTIRYSLLAIRPSSALKEIDQMNRKTSTPTAEFDRTTMPTPVCGEYGLVGHGDAPALSEVANNSSSSRLGRPVALSCYPQRPTARAV
jgi:hypothetical protein